MKPLLLSAICTFLLFGSASAACYFDSDTVWFYQGKPYEATKFEGRHWGDPFEWWYRTASGYTFISEVNMYGENHFYYATLDGSGEFAATDSIVGVHSAPAGSYQLDRSSARKSALDSLRLVAYPNNSTAIDSTRARMERASGLDEPVVYQVGLLLVHFSNTDYEDSWVNNTDDIENWPSEPFAVVDDQFNLTDHQFEHPNIEQNDPVWGAENEIICGSFRDYWWETSHYTIETNCTIINPWTRDDDPDNDTWLELDHTCEHYWPDQGGLCRDAMSEATALGWIDAADDAFYDQILVISLPQYLNQHAVICNESPQGIAWVGGIDYSYGGHDYNFPTTSLSLVKDHFWGEPGHPNDLDWMHIGLPSHEYGHLIGYVFCTASAGSNNESGFMSLMGTGNNVGDQYAGECPPRLRAPELMALGIPEYLHVVGRGEVIDITSDVTDVTISAPTNSTHYFYRRALSTGDTFLIEAVDLARERATWDAYITQPATVRHPPDLEVNLLVWRYDESTSCNGTNRPSSLRSKFVEMGDPLGSRWSYYPEWQGRTIDILPGTENRRSFTPFVNQAHTLNGVPASLVGTATPATEHSNFAILNVRGGNYPATAVTADFRVNWPWNITGNDTLYAPFDLRQDITINSGATLTILPAPYYFSDHEVTCTLDKEISVTSGGKLVVKGTAADPITFLSGGADTWDGIKVQSGSIVLDYVSIYDAKTYCVHTSSPSGGTTPVTISNSYFDGASIVSGGNVLRLWGSPGYTQKVENCQIDNVPLGSGLYLYNCLVDFDDVTVLGCDYINSYLKTVSGSFRSCVFEGRTSNYAVLCNSATCNPNFMCCEFTNLAPNTGSFKTTFFSATGCSPTFGGYGYTDGVSNVFVDNSDYLMVIQGTGLLPKINSSGITVPRLGGKNDWYQNSGTGKFIEWRNAPAVPSSAFNAKSQYWSPTASTAMFTPSSTTYFDFTLPHSPAYDVCGGAEGSGGSSVPKDPFVRETRLDEGEDLESLEHAMYLESIDSVVSAFNIYSGLVENAQSTETRLAAATGLVTTSCRVQGNNAWLIDAIEEVESSDSIYATRVLCARLRGNYYLKANEFDDAIATFSSLLSSGLIQSDSVYVASELLGAQMASGLDGFGGPLDDAISELIPITLRISSIDEGVRKELELFDLLNDQATPDQVGELLPTEFLLYQNYPNPFNPTTQIEFDLPLAVRVSLKVFNTLGQEVATVNDAMYPAGHHLATWNGKSNEGADVATGLYIYQIKAGAFTDTKKMVLMR